MARKEDKNSTRQKAFAMLKRMKTTSRSAAVKRIVEKFEISESYAMTIFQHHRNNMKAANELTKVYTVRDHKDGKVVEPYMSKAHVADTEGQATTRGQAVKAYNDSLKGLMASAKGLTKAPVAIAA